jgi:hypothetical protein
VRSFLHRGSLFHFLSGRETRELPIAAQESKDGQEFGLWELASTIAFPATLNFGLVLNKRYPRNREVAQLRFAPENTTLFSAGVLF